MTSVEINIYDNELTTSLKYANILKTVVKFLYIENDEYLNVTELIESYMLENLDIKNILEKLYDKNITISIYDIVMIYTYIAVIKYKQSIDDVFAIVKNISSELNIDNKQIIPEYGISLDLKNSLDSWINNYNILITVETAKLESVLNEQNILNQIQPISTSEIIVNKTTAQYKVKWLNGNDIDSIDGIEIFSKSVPSMEVPYIQYNEIDGKSLYRLYYDENKYDKEYLKLILLSSAQTMKNNHLYITCHIGKDLKSDTQNFYIECIYNLETGYLKTTYTEKLLDEKIFIERMSLAFPTIRLSEKSIIKINGEFDIDIDVDENSLFYLVINDSLLSSYFYIDEKEAPQCEKRSLNLHSNLNKDEKIIISFGNKNTENKLVLSEKTETEDIETEDTYTITKYKNVNIIGGSLQIINNFMNIFRRLMSYYNSQTNNTIEFINLYIKDSTTKNIKKIANSREAKDSKMRNIKNMFLDVFDNFRNKQGEVYSRSCECKKQPIVIGKDEVEEWRNNTFLKNGVVTRRDVLQYPPDKNDSEKYFVCPTDKYKYPVLIDNFYSVNSDKYPYVPCCEINSGETEENAKIKYLKGLNKSQELRENKHLKKDLDNTVKRRSNTTKNLNIGETCNVPIKLSNILNEGMEKFPGQIDDFTYIGVQPSPASIIHSICTALRDSVYLNLQTNEDREVYINKKRMEISQKISPLLYKQELYDMSINGIINNISNPKYYLDPYIYYRGLEEFFNINIFIFNSSGHLNPIPGISEDTKDPVLEIPRCKLMHIRTERLDRPTVIINKQHKNLNINPQCDLIISGGRKDKLLIEECDEEDETDEICCTIPIKTNLVNNRPIVMSEPVYTFGVNLTKILYDVLKRSLHTYSFMYPNLSESESKLLQTRDDPFSYGNWEKIFNRRDIKLLEQKIDSCGKLRILNLQYNNNIISIVLPPSQPLNLPNLTKIYKSDEKTVRNLLGEPTGVITSGLWYKVFDYIYGLYIPCTIISPISITAPTSPIYEESISNSNEEPIQNTRNTQRWASILVQLIKWLWKIDNRESLDKWWDKYIIKDNTVNKILPLNINRNLPTVNNVLEGIQYISNFWPSYFNNGKIHLYNSLYYRLLDFFKREEVMTKNLEDDLPTRLEGVYLWDTDFPNYPQSYLFLNKEDFTLWVEYNFRSNEEIYKGFNNILTKIDISIAHYTIPILYEDVNKKFIYLIQNVKNGELNRALSVALIWFMKGFNQGFDTEVLENVNFPYVIYGISKKGDIIPLSSNSNQDTYLQILKYNDNTYSALLKLN